MAKYLQTLLPDFTFINGDDYFEPVDNQTVWGVFNDERFIHDVITPLKKGAEFIYQPYNWQTKQTISREITVDVGFVFERCYSFSFDLDWDLKIWLETPRQICLERGLARDHMPKDRVLSAWKDVWQPQEDIYIQKEHPMEQANMVIYGDKPFKDQLTF